MKMITKTLLRKVIKDVCPDPRIPGPFRVIADVGDCGYYDQRAVEAIRSGDRVLGIQLLLLSEATESLESDRPVEKGTTTSEGDKGDYPDQTEVEHMRGSNDLTVGCQQPRGHG